jgi:uncharacterized DUF497 family protein
MATRFAWDEKKNRANRRKHRIGFETALLVFDDPNAIAVQDREIEGEQRWQTVGRAHSAIIVVAHSIHPGAESDAIRTDTL